METLKNLLQKNNEIANLAERPKKSKNLKIKMDSACSLSMSGVPGRIIEESITSPIRIHGFNGDISETNITGKNMDNKEELYVPDMPNDLVLLCANSYAQDGAVVLFPNNGYHLYMNDDERDQLESLVREYRQGHSLTVRNRTYEVIKDFEETNEDQLLYAYSSNSHKYFNTNINVTNIEERVLTYLLSGLTINDMKTYIKNQHILGFHPDVIISALTEFANKWGHTPDVLQLAKPNKMGNIKGYLTEQEELTDIGQVVQADFLESDFNQVEENEQRHEDSTILKKKRTKKLPTHGGAVAAFLVVDGYSQYLIGTLVKSTANAAELVKETIAEYAKHGHKITLFSADSGVTSQSTFRVFTPEVESLCLDKHIHTRRAEPYNHSNGTAIIEGMIRPVKNLIRMAMQYILRNPNLKYLGFTKKQILQLWGEIFYWAICIMNLKECKHCEGTSRFEVFLKKIPNIQEIRLLPIFAFVMVLRHASPSASVDGADRDFLQYGLYVGPDNKVKGAIRAAILTNTGPF